MRHGVAHVQQRVSNYTLFVFLSNTRFVAAIVIDPNQAWKRSFIEEKNGHQQIKSLLHWVAMLDYIHWFLCKISAVFVVIIRKSFLILTNCSISQVKLRLTFNDKTIKIFRLLLWKDLLLKQCSNQYTPNLKMGKNKNVVFVDPIIRMMQETHIFVVF